MAVACGVYGDVFLCCPFSHDEILNLIESVSEGFPSYTLEYFCFEYVRFCVKHRTGNENLSEQ